MSRSVGLDVHKTVVQASIVEQTGQEILQLRFGCSREELEQFATKHLLPTDRVALEATTNTWAVYAVIAPFVAEVVVSNPLQTKLIAAGKIKTDKVDANVLAQLLRSDFLPRVWAPPETVQAMRALTGRRAALIADRTAIKNRIHATLRQRLISAPDNLFRAAAGVAWLATLQIDEPGRLALDSDMRLLEQYDQELDQINRLLLEKSASSEDVKLLVSLPGVDYPVAQTLLATLGDISRFKDGDHAASYVGLVPSTRQSANHCYHGSITKQGNSRARWLLVQAAQAVANHPGPLGAFFRRITKKRGRNIAVVATARKLVVIAWHMLTKREPYRYAQPATVEPKLRRIRTAGGTKLRAKPGTVATKPHPEDDTKVLRRTPGLPEVYRKEGVPSCKPLASGELKMLREHRLVNHVATLQSERWVTKPKRAR